MNALLRLSLAACISCTLPIGLQAQHPVIQNVLEEASIDSMLQYVRWLSGEDPVDVGNGPEYIYSRHMLKPGNALSAQWIIQKLEGWGYEPNIQSWSPSGENILVSKPGVLFPESTVVFCAHYDAMPGGPVEAPAADDNASGVAALLEAARLLSDIEFEHRVLFAFWDEEEQGLVGSAFHAGGEAANNAVIHAVINMDAIAYDGNGDTQARVHTRPIANSIAISDTTFSVLETYGIDIDLILTNPGAAYSDHASYWNEGYGAVLIIEEFGADGNPY